jgi:hypothetical protein
VIRGDDVLHAMKKSPQPEKPDKVVAKIMETWGLASEIARACGIAPQAVYQWKRVPPHWVMIVSDIMKIPPEQIRPDIFKPKKR